MSDPLNLVGKVFGRLTVLNREKNNSYGKTRWLCRCVCGTEKIIGGRELMSGNTLSCGCYNKEKYLKHGHAKKGNHSKTYKTWADMMTRCYNPKCPRYEDYDGRGVIVCEGWHRFENFLEDMGEKPEGLSLDRFPVSTLEYNKENCRWATGVQQNMNERKTKRICTSKYKGVYWDKEKEKFKACLGIDYTQVCLGYYDIEEEAALAYNESARRYYGEDAFLNIID